MRKPLEHLCVLVAGDLLLQDRKQRGINRKHPFQGDLAEVSNRLLGTMAQQKADALGGFWVPAIAETPKQFPELLPGLGGGTHRRHNRNRGSESAEAKRATAPQRPLVAELGRRSRGTKKLWDGLSSPSSSG